MQNRLILALLLATSTCPVSVHAQVACEFPAAYFFGASNLDTGNFMNHPHWGAQDWAPLPENGYWKNRWQSGPVWADHFAERLGLPPSVSSQASSEGGNNYAFGAASTSPHPGETPVDPSDPGHALYFSTQIDQALEDADNELDPEAIYVIEIGHNDTIYGRTPAQAPAAGGVVITQMQRLRDAGAEILMVRLLGPGLDPYATPFNQAILSGVETLRGGGATVYVVDHADFIYPYLTVEYLASIGITQFGAGVNCRANAGCQSGATTAAQNDEVYDNAYLFFDTRQHWNHKVHADIAKHALAQIPDCENILIDGFESP